MTPTPAEIAAGLTALQREGVALVMRGEDHCWNAAKASLLAPGIVTHGSQGTSFTPLGRAVAADLLLALMAERNLKQVLMELGNRLVSLGAIPANENRMVTLRADHGNLSGVYPEAIWSGDAGASLEPLLLLTEWLNSYPDARNVLYEMGYAWPTVSPLDAKDSERANHWSDALLQVLTGGD